jgi:hypothetical protein
MQRLSESYLFTDVNTSVYLTKTSVYYLFRDFETKSLISDCLRVKLEIYGFKNMTCLDVDKAISFEACGLNALPQHIIARVLLKYQDELAKIKSELEAQKVLVAPPLSDGSVELVTYAEQLIFPPLDVSCEPIVTEVSPQQDFDDGFLESGVMPDFLASVISRAAELQLLYASAIVRFEAARAVKFWLDAFHQAKEFRSSGVFRGDCSPLIFSFDGRELALPRSEVGVELLRGCIESCPGPKTGNGTRPPRKRTKQKKDRTDPALRLVPLYKGMPSATHIVQGTAIVSTTIVTSGQVATNVTLSSAQIPNFATRFEGYDEFRIIKAEARMMCTSSTCTGIMNAWFVEDTVTTPSSALAFNTKKLQFNLSAVNRPHVLTYSPHDPAQQTWTVVNGGAPAIGYFKLYTDTANFGAPAVVTICLVTNFYYTVQFRGFV